MALSVGDLPQDGCNLGGNVHSRQICVNLVTWLYNMGVCSSTDMSWKHKFLDRYEPRFRPDWAIYIYPCMFPYRHLWSEPHTNIGFKCQRPTRNMLGNASLTWKTLVTCQVGRVGELLGIYGCPSHGSPSSAYLGGCEGKWRGIWRGSDKAGVNWSVVVEGLGAV